MERSAEGNQCLLTKEESAVVVSNQRISQRINQRSRAEAAAEAKAPSVDLMELHKFSRTRRGRRRARWRRQQTGKEFDKSSGVVGAAGGLEGIELVSAAGRLGRSLTSPVELAARAGRPRQRPCEHFSFSDQQSLHYHFQHLNLLALPSHPLASVTAT